MVQSPPKSLTFIRIVLSLLTVCIVVSFASPTIADAPEIIAKISSIKNRYNVRVHYLYRADEYFSDQWRKPPISGRGGQLPLEEVERLLPLIEGFLSGYPDTILEENLENIYLLSDLNFYGKNYGATNSKSGLYIRSEGRNAGFSDSFLLARMHSEFSSILMRNYDFPEAEWHKINRAGFEYVGRGRDVLGQPNLYGQTDKLLSDGFIVQYAQSSMENDFNMIVDWLFTKPSELRRLAQKYPRIKSKMELAINFYESIDNRFDFR